MRLLPAWRVLICKGWAVVLVDDAGRCNPDGPRFIPKSKDRLGRTGWQQIAGAACFVPGVLLTRVVGNAISRSQQPVLAQW
jgi:hypothetical protein